MQPESANPTLSWNPLRDVGALLEYHFMVDALLAGTVVAVLAGAVGWMMIVRGETFVGHTLSVMAFPGASGAALIGVAPAWGYFSACGASALAIGGLLGPGDGPRAERSAAVASIQALALAAGFLFASLGERVLGDLEVQLFGSALGVSDAQVLTLAIVAACALVALGAIARPLLFASVDSDVARARGVRVRGVSTAYLLLLGVTVAATTQVTGLLLSFALLVAPAASAQALTPRPGVSLALTVALAVLIVWLGLGISYFSPYPAGFFLASSATVVYALARLARALATRMSRRGAWRAAPGAQAAGA